MSTEREVVIKTSVDDNIGDRLLQILEQRDALNGQIANVLVNVQTQGLEKIQGVQNEITKTSGLLGKIGGVASEASSVAAGALGTFQNAIQDTGAAVTKLLGSVALIGAGGAVAGISWVSSEQLRNYKEQIASAIGANKQWGVSVDQVNDMVAKATEKGYTTQSGMLEAFQVASTKASKYRKGQALLTTTEGAVKIAFAEQETFKGSGADLLSMATRQTLRPEQKTTFAKTIEAAGVKVTATDSRLNSVAGRLKLIDEAAKNIDMDKALREHSWVVAANRVEMLKEKIGDALAPTLEVVSNKVAEFTKYLSERPDIAWLIGMGAVIVTAVGAISLLIGVLTPLYGVIVAVKNAHVLSTIATWAHNAAQMVLAATSTESAVSQAMLAGAFEADFAAEELATGGAVGFLGALLPLIAPAIAVAAVIGLVAYKAGILGPLLKGFQSINLGKVFKDLAKGDFGKAWKDITKGFKLPSLQEMIGNLTSGIDLGKIRGVLDFAAMAVPILKPLLMIYDFIYKLWVNSGGLNKMFMTGLTYWQSIANFSGDLWTGIQGIWGWVIAFWANFVDQIKNIIPKELGGYSEEEKASRSAAEKEGKLLHWLVAYNHRQAGGQPASAGTSGINNNLNPSGWFKGPLAVLNNLNPANQSGMPSAGLDENKQYTSKGGIQQSGKGWTRYYNDLMSQGRAKEANDMMAGLKDASGNSPTSATPSLPTGDNGIGDGSGWGSVSQGSYSAENPPGSDYSSNASALGSMAQGGPITSHGFIFGHKGEEVTPASVVQGGMTTLERINNIVGSQSQSMNGGNNSGPQSAPVTINLNFHVDKIEREVDIDRLLFRARNDLDKMFLRGIGVLRG